MKDSFESFEKFISSYETTFLAGWHGTNKAQVYRAAQLIRQCTGIVWLVGNGGSASLASHMATDLQLAGIRAQALTDVAAITTYANDFCYEYSFSKQVQKLVKAEDVLIAISGSGSSPNIYEAARDAIKAGAIVIALTGWDGGLLGSLGVACHINSPTFHMGAAQDCHQSILHWITYYLMGLNKGKVGI